MQIKSQESNFRGRFITYAREYLSVRYAISGNQQQVHERVKFLLDNWNFTCVDASTVSTLSLLLQIVTNWRENSFCKQTPRQGHFEHGLLKDLLRAYFRPLPAMSQSAGFGGAEFVDDYGKGLPEESIAFAMTCVSTLCPSRFLRSLNLAILRSTVLSASGSPARNLDRPSSRPRSTDLSGKAALLV